LSAFLLAGSLLWDRCLSCRTLAAQEPVHDCCHQGSCHRDSGQPPAGKECPHQTPALEGYAKVDPVIPGAEVAALPLDTDAAPAPLPTPRMVSAAPLLVHSPPDLYLRNSTLLI